MEQNALNSMRDFLQVYNYISESCFLRCINNFNTRELTDDEGRCIDLCSHKHINVNHKVMNTFVELQPAINQKRMEEAADAQRKQLEQLEAARALEEEDKQLNATEVAS